MGRDLGDCPLVPLLGLALQVELLGQPGLGLRGGDPGEAGQSGDPEEPESFLAARPEVRGRGTQHQTVDPLAVSLPHQRGDRTAHAVPDGDDPLDAQHVAGRHRVVGTVGEGEPLARPDAAAVAAVVEGDHRAHPAERVVAPEPVEVGRGRPAVEEQQRRGALGTLDGAHVGGAASGQFHRRPVRQARVVHAVSITR